MNDLLSLSQAADAELARRDLREFILRFWPVVEKASKYRHGWHIDCICDHLQAVSDGDITRLLINIPPRHMKSTLCSVMYPAWQWLQNPEKKFLNASYSQHLAIRDCRKSRNIISHPLYTSLLAHDDEGNPEWEMSSDQNVKSMYANTETGQRFATSVGGTLTGEGGDVIIIDDPHNVQDISPNSLDAVQEWWDESLPTRLNDPKTGAFIVIMQRVNARDLSGHILDKGEDFVHLCLPARFEGQCRITTTLADWKDPRTKKNEPLWPEHYDDAALGRLEKSMTAYSKAGQLQQRPAPREGGIFKKKDFQVIKAIPKELHIVRSLRYWDKAGTEDGGAATAGVLIHLLSDGSLCIADVVRGQWSYGKREAKLKATSISDYGRYAKTTRKTYAVHFEQEPGSGGKESAERTRMNLLQNKDGSKTELNGCKIVIDRVTGAKEVRAEPYAVQVENHNVYVLDRTWTDCFLDEHTSFPNGVFKDQVDAAGAGVTSLTGKRKKAGGW